MVAGVELDYDTSATALEMAQTIFGAGTTVNSASYTGSSYSSAIWTNGDAIAPGATPSDSGVILSTGRATSFTRDGSQSNASSNTTTNSGGPNNQADFNAAAGTSTYDASYLDINFTPTGNVMTMQFTFASDEFPEYSNSIYNDIVGVWINGQYVNFEVGDGNVAVGNVNQNENVNLFNDNTGDQFNTEMDGFTVTMTLTIPVNPGVPNDIRIGIADTADSNYDSNLLIAADSVQTELVALTDDVTMQEGTTKTVDVLANDLNFTGDPTITITEINGIAVGPGDSVTLQTGQTVTLNADMTFTITTDTDNDTVSFTYGIEADGETDVGFVKVTTIPCFVAGSLIATPDGERPVESLRPGDLVLTRDDGPQPVRWIGLRRVAAVGAFAPVEIAAGTFGDHRRIRVSPQHRVLIEDPTADLLFDAPEVLVAAKDLVDGRQVRRVEGGEVDYVHILFDRHEVVLSDGLPTESFLPGPQITNIFEAEVVEEICALFPELDPLTGEGYGPAARRLLRAWEAQALLGRAA